MKRFIAGLGCIGLLAILVGVYGLIQTGAYEELLRGGTPSTDFIGRMFSPRIYRYSIIAGLVALIFAGLDIFTLTTRVKTVHRDEPQPKDHPLAFLAVRARRYFLVLAVIAYIPIFWRTMEYELRDWLPVTQASLLIFVGLFALARRPMNMTIYQVFKGIPAHAEDALDSFLEKRVVTRQSDKMEARRR